MSKKRTLRALAVVAGGALCLTAIPLSACTKSRDDIIIMATEEFSGLFNPFYATSGADIEVVNLTQLAMLTTDADGNLVAGNDYATAVLDYEITEDGGDSVYTFVLKNGLKFSDGVPLTMNDVMFNIYEYLDPVYTGSSTMYSIKIKGLSQYRTQRGSTNDADDPYSAQAYSNAKQRRDLLVNVFRKCGEPVGSGDNISYYADEATMTEAILKENISSRYKQMVPMEEGDDDYNARLLKDYQFARDTFQKELESDFRAARESFDLTTAPYKDWASKLQSDVFKFLLYEGYITPKYRQDETTGGKEDTSQIVSFNGENEYANITTEEAAIKKVFEDNFYGNFEMVLTAWGTAGDVLTEFAADAKEMLIKAEMKDGKYPYSNVSGIVSLGHTGTETEVTVNGTKYNVARGHNSDGTPSVANTYDVLRITLDGKDPKAEYNFAFSVAPVHYYSGRKVDIANDEFGVEYNSASFQRNVIQSLRNVEIPLGAGPYKASNSSNADSISKGDEFYRNNYVFYKANDNFMFPVKTEKLRYQYVTSTTALDKLASKELDFVTPQFTKENSARLDKMESKGFTQLYSWQLGYGYIGINAGKVKSINARKAIMAAMETELSTKYYKQGTCVPIDWPMSNQSWAYPKGQVSGYDYVQWTGRSAALSKIREYTEKARTLDGATDKDFELKFTIAGASITEHPTYNVFKQAAELLKECGWKVEVKADSQALTKLSTGSLAVWAAAWGSTIDPDMYQVYHKNSTATSVYAWGYREILNNTTYYSTEYALIRQLSDIIDDARSITDKDDRTTMYKNAMELVLQLAVEMPVYQRQNLYAYNSNRISGLPKNSDEINAYTSPLEKIWELEIL